MIATAEIIREATEEGRTEGLIRAIQSGDPEARDRALEALIRDFSLLVAQVARRFDGMGLDHEDLVSEGALGLIKAADKFELARGTKFSTYAVYWVSHYIRRAIDNHGRTIRIPCRTIDKIRRMRRARAELTEELGREPLDEEIAARLSITANMARKLRLRDVHAYPFNQPVGREAGYQPGEDYPDAVENTPEHLTITRDSCRFFHKLLHSLDDREAKIVKMYFGFDAESPLTHAAISQHVGVSSERVRQIYKGSLRKLRVMMTRNLEDIRPLLA